MSPTAPVVWVVAGVDTAARWVGPLRRAGLAAGALPWSAPHAVPSDGAAEGDADLVLLTSRHAVEALAPHAGAGRAAACVGAATAEAARRRGFSTVFVGDAGGAALAADLLAARPTLRRVLFLAGREARREAVEALEQAGVSVTTVVVYEMRTCDDFARRVHEAPEPAAIVLGSPRAAEALREALDAAARILPPTAFCAVLGAVTAERAQTLFDRYVAVSECTDPEGLAATVRETLDRKTDGSR